MADRLKGRAYAEGSRIAGSKRLRASPRTPLAGPAQSFALCALMVSACGPNAARVTLDAASASTSVTLAPVSVQGLSELDIDIAGVSSSMSCGHTLLVVVQSCIDMSPRGHCPIRGTGPRCPGSAEHY